jgi:hypothetical protein
MSDFSFSAPSNCYDFPQSFVFLFRTATAFNSILFLIAFKGFAFGIVLYHC